MAEDYNESIDSQELKQLVASENWDEAFDLLAQPLHIWLNQEGTFETLADRTPYEQLILSFDYIQGQIGQGGFIQLIQNGYAPLLVVTIESLQQLQMGSEMVKVLDDALKVYVLNHEALSRETSVEEFGKLYSEFNEFEALEVQFTSLRILLLIDLVNRILAK